MIAWFRETIDVLGTLSFVIAILLFLVALMVRYGKEETFKSSPDDKLSNFEHLSLQYNKLEEAYKFMQGAAIAALVAFLIFRIIHFKP